jgi:hypothetical protein
MRRPICGTPAPSAILIAISRARSLAICEIAP